jgi:hypothetical protein
MRRLLVALALVLFPVATLAQGLGQAAAQERERREKKAREGNNAPAPRTFTDDDLKSPEEREKEREKAKGTASKQAPQTPTPQAAPSRSDIPDTAPRGTREGGAIQYEPEHPRDAPGGEAAAPAAPQLEENADAIAWRERARPARAAVDAARAREASIEGRIAQLRQELNPMSANYQLDPNRFLQIQDEIRVAEADLAAARQETRTAQEAWEQVLEEARRAGVRPDL